MPADPIHIFVDESVRSKYLLGAVLIRPRDLAAIRRTLRSLVLPRERSIHFNNESMPRKRQLLDAFTQLPGIRGHIYASAHHNTTTARAACMAALADDLASRDCRRLVIESRESRDASDRKILAAAQRTHAGLRDMIYEHMRPHEEPGLWLADGILWAYGAGGPWKARTSELIETVIDADI